MQLSQEDSLRLNVLLNQSLHALRIDEGKMIIYGLTEKGEAKIQLNPTCKDEIYIRRVKETISSHILGSPGGYPVFLKRWTRMGQARAESLEGLLKLGEPEAVIAVVGSEGLTDELARRAWWAMPTSDNARRMLQRSDVAKGTMGRVLADFLIEFLPFEEEPRSMVESVRLVLQEGLLNEEERYDLWRKGQRKNAYLVGFLSSSAENLPEQVNPHREYDELNEKLQPLLSSGNPFATFLMQVLAREGQAYLKTVDSVLKKPANQDVVVALFEAIESYFSPIRPHQASQRDINKILDDASRLNTCCADEVLLESINEVLESAPDAKELVESIIVISFVGEQLVAPIFALTDAVGTVMRRKIEPVTKPLLMHIDRLRGL